MQKWQIATFKTLNDGDTDSDRFNRAIAVADASLFDDVLLRRCKALHVVVMVMNAMYFFLFFRKFTKNYFIIEKCLRILRYINSLYYLCCPIFILKTVGIPLPLGACW